MLQGQMLTLQPHDHTHQAPHAPNPSRGRAKDKIVLTEGELEAQSLPSRNRCTPHSLKEKFPALSVFFDIKKVEIWIHLENSFHLSAKIESNT